MDGPIFGSEGVRKDLGRSLLLNYRRAFSKVARTRSDKEFAFRSSGLESRIAA
jgi:hypothetical protein